MILDHHDLIWISRSRTCHNTCFHNVTSPYPWSCNSYTWSTCRK